MKFNKQINKNKNLMLLTLSLASIISLGLVGCSNSEDNSNNSNNSIANIPENLIPELTDEIILEIDNFNYKLDEFYITTWNDNRYLSRDSYLVTNNFAKIIPQDVSETLNLEIPEVLSDMQIHFAIPKDLLPYLEGKINEEDLSILTVYTAVFTEDGVYISSKYDEGGIISFEEYQEFINNHSWENGDINILTSAEHSENANYLNIVQALVADDPTLEGLDVKYLAHDTKDAIIIIGSPTISTDIRQYALEKNESGAWQIAVDELEGLDPYIYVNYYSTNFNLALLPNYVLANHMTTSLVESLIEALLENGSISEDDVITYVCASGNFTYFMFENGTKLVTHLNSTGDTDLYYVDTYMDALQLMSELESNPPTFIVKYKD